MKTEKFNLIDEDWLPVLMSDGTSRRVNLRDVFTENSGIADLSMVAYERISVMRLLICIAMAAVSDEDIASEWAWLALKAKLSGSVLAYLDKWHGRFNLFGDHAFLQPDGLTATKMAEIEKLFPHRASGNNGTLFDHSALSVDSHVVTEDWPVGMLTYLNFSAGGRHSQCIWSGVSTEGTVTAGPCREKSMIHTILCSDSLLTTVWQNLITRQMLETMPNQTLGRPVWECKDYERETLRVSFDAEALLGRLVPLSRVMKLKLGVSCFPLGEGLKYKPLPESREIMGAVFMRNKTLKNEDPRSYVSVSEEEMPWRNLRAILAMEDMCGTLTMRHLPTLVENNPDAVCSLWSGGLVADKAKDVAFVEWRTSFMLRCLNDYHLQIYQKGVEFAEFVSTKQIYSAAKTYCDAMKMDGTDVIANPVRRRFWDMLNRRQTMLQEMAFAGEGDFDLWRAFVIQAARDSFMEMCPHQTGRQLSAFVKAASKLNFKKEG